MRMRTEELPPLHCQQQQQVHSAYLIYVCSTHSLALCHAH
jgi:hypothetical protein